MKLKWISIITIAVMLIGGQAFVANEVRAESQSDVLLNSFGDADVSADEFAASAGDILPAPDYKDLVFTPCTPCRILDTRRVGGAFGHGTRREYYVYGGSDVSAQGGNAAGCYVPGYAYGGTANEPAGSHINVTAIPLTGSGGYFTVFPANVGPPTASVVNYRAGSYNAIANAVSVKNYRIWGPREIEFLNMYGTSQLAVDVMGYYMPNPWH